MDSDVAVTVKYPMNVVIGYISKKLKWVRFCIWGVTVAMGGVTNILLSQQNLDQRPVALNQDGPGWSCKHALQHNMPVSYSVQLAVLVWLTPFDAVLFQLGSGILEAMSCSHEYHSEVVGIRGRLICEFSIQSQVEAEVAVGTSSNVSSIHRTQRPDTSSLVSQSNPLTMDE
jgi:hypothetical protein